MFWVSLSVAIRSRFLVLLAISLGLTTLSFSLAYLFGGRQPITTALDVSISVVRLCIPFVLIVLSGALVFREFESRTCVSSLSYPRSRFAWAAARFFAVLFCAFIVLVACVVLVAGFLHVVDSKVQVSVVEVGLPYIVMVGFMAVDLLVIASVVFFLSIYASSSSFILMGGLGFALVARSYSSIVALLEATEGLVFAESAYQQGIGILFYIFPDLGALDVRGVALYGRMSFLPKDFVYNLMASFLFSLLFFMMAVVRLQKRDVT